MQLIEYALACQPLTFDAPLVSQHLKTIELERVNLECSALNFSGCPVLEGLKMIHCWTYARSLPSESLKYLCITGSCSMLDDSHMRIYTPALISLQLDDFHGSAPYLENMPYLVAAQQCYTYINLHRFYKKMDFDSAYVRVGKGCCNSTFCNINMEEDCDVPCCDCHAYPVDEGVLLNGLTHAVNLGLIAEPEKIIYSWDLERRPIFGNLKTLLLNEWFTTICNTEKLIGTTGAQETVKESFVCAHLKVVNIECGKVDEGIHKILKILSTCGVPHQQISIKDPCSRSDRKFLCRSSVSVCFCNVITALFVMFCCNYMSTLVYENIAKPLYPISIMVS
ncbi:uncharacterized protein LOC123405826 [Hordeum vulgare subsp. vulgare]|uniref:uncharacterized protein LOC123405826 n=1 Tax=Hordeum vulgare subsp. vulgare TaxID=112509 RepID=UPI001D1A5503|nr:uncharacterized protein LOC123405826 [Hordeum vulgare subsp. vulgare]